MAPRSAALLVLGLLAWSVPLFAADKKVSVPMTGVAEAKFAPLDEVMTAVVEKLGVAGASLAVIKEGKIVYSRGFGVADRDTKLPVQPDSLFRLCSVSKTLTAAAIVKLIEQDKLRLEASVCDVLGVQPSGRKSDDRWHHITIRHLLEHRGGWDSKESKFDPMYSPSPILREMNVLPPVTPRTIVAYMLRQPLDFDPGYKFAYSNFGYCLLGRVIEKVSKQSYEKFVQQEILQPLGITRMRLGRTLLSQRAADEVRYHSPQSALAVTGPLIGRSVSAPYGGFSLEAMDADAGWIGSARDLARFAHTFDDPEKCKILNAESVKSLFARSRDEDSKKDTSYYGRGWWVQPLGKDQIVYWHDGALAGAASMVVRRPDGVTFAVLFNSRGKEGDPEPVAVANGPLHQAVSRIFASR